MRQLLPRARGTAGHDEIAATLGAEILSGSRPPGSRLPSAEEFLERFEASRVLMREVTKTLVAKGLVAAKTRVGTIVLPSEYWNWFDPDVLAWRARLGGDADFLCQLAQIRRAVESAAAMLAAEVRTEAQLAEMRSALEAMTRAGNDRRAFADAELDFHTTVAAASGNPLFRTLTAVIEAALDAAFALTAPVVEADMKHIVRMHTKIADAIEKRDGTRASRAMIAVIDEGRH